jgi:hypothetical protein
MDKVKVIVKSIPSRSQKELLWVYSFVHVALTEAGRFEEAAYLRRIFANTEGKDYNDLMDILKQYADIEYEEKLN